MEIQRDFYLVVKDDFRPWYDDNGILYVGLLDFLQNESLT